MKKICAAVLFLMIAAAAPASTATTDHAEVLPGIDVLKGQDYAPLKGKQVGLITNQTGVDSDGHSTADLLYKAPNVKLIGLFSPEHGIRGTQTHGQAIGDAIDPKTHLPVYSLYGAVQKPTPEMLNAMDVLVFDMQDVGTRFYTYLTTMGLCMEAAASRGIEFVVLDRPNPLGGEVLEGEILDPRWRHFTAYYNIPVRHGMTAGELAQWYNKTARLNAKLKVIPMAGWKRSDLWEDTGLPFTPPSPNIQTPTEALLYPGIGMFEATNVSVGRGTDAPFERFGAPWMNGVEVAKRLNAAHLPGVYFRQTMFVPSTDLYQDHLCSGVRMVVIDPRAIRPIDIFVDAALAIRDTSGKDFQPRWEEMARVTGSQDFEEMFKTGRPASEILDAFHRSAEKFRKQRQPFLLY